MTITVAELTVADELVAVLTVSCELLATGRLAEEQPCMTKGQYSYRKGDPDFGFDHGVVIPSAWDECSHCHRLVR